jgi:histidinol-phosphate aminotransferase
MTPIRENVLRMEPYSPGKPVSEVRRELGLDRVIKLASNENPLGPSPKAMAAVRDAAATMHIYPDGSAYELRCALAGKYDLPAGNLLLGNGSDELIHLLGRVTLDEGDEMIVGDPSFSRYDASAHLSRSSIVKVPLDSEAAHDLPAMARAVTERTRLLYIANPNNPTGTIVRKKEVDRLFDEVPEHVLVILDEAYYEFAADVPDFPDSLDYLKKRRNVVGLRTLSKAYGLAGIRIGFGFAPEYVVDAVNRAREPFNVNSLAQAAAVAALDDLEHVRRTVENNRAGIQRISDALKSVGATAFDSYANYVYAEFDRPSKPIFDGLLRQGIITRTGAAFGRPNGLRVSIGTSGETDAFVSALKTVCAAAV